MLISNLASIIELIEEQVPNGKSCDFWFLFLISIGIEKIIH